MNPLPPSSDPVNGFQWCERTVCRHLHDVRNCINGLSLELTLLAELVSDAGAIESVRRMTRQVRDLEAVMRGLAIRFADPQPVPLTASDLLELWRLQVASLDDPVVPIRWSPPPGPTWLEVDPTSVASVLRGLTAEALKRSPGNGLHLVVRTTEAEVIAELRVPISQPTTAEQWLDDLAHIIRRNGGLLRRAVAPGTSDWTISLHFPVANAVANAAAND